MTKHEKVARLQSALKRHRAEYHQPGAFVDRPWATADEQRKSAANILGDIEGQLRSLGVYR